MILLILFIKYRNRINILKEAINESRSQVRILKAKYFQVLKKVQIVQDNSLTSQSHAYQSAAAKGVGTLAGGASGKIDDSFSGASHLVETLANDYAEAQKSLNAKIKEYNSLVVVFPKSLFAYILKLKREEYIDEENLDQSMLIKDFGEDI